MVVGTAFKNKGIQPLLDAVVDYLPSPLDAGEVKGTNPDNGETITRKPADSEPFSALAFKIMADPFVGQLDFHPRLLRASSSPETRCLTPAVDAASALAVC